MGAFDSKNLQNDFALIHLAEEFPLTQHINTMCLPDPFYADEEFDDDETSYDTSDCFATGWGKDKFGSDGEYQVILKQVQMDIEDHDQCENEFQQSRLGKNFQLDDSFLCAGGQQGKDTCKGDGGGPLVCPSKSNPGRYEQVGIVAWGLGCGEETPGVYADVSKALRFIDWATKCIDGTDRDYYGFGFGDRWAKHEYCEYKEKIDDYENDVAEEKRKKNFFPFTKTLSLIAQEENKISIAMYMTMVLMMRMRMRNLICHPMQEIKMLQIMKDLDKSFQKLVLGYRSQND